MIAVVTVVGVTVWITLCGQVGIAPSGETLTEAGPGDSLVSHSPI